MMLNGEFYQRDDVVLIARELLGKELVTRIGGRITSGIINETEAYNGVVDRASHAFGGKRTPRNEQMYAAGGNAYVYLCYGIHHLFNVVTNVAGIPHAVLIRSIIPQQGIDTMRTRRATPGKPTTTGPGTLTQALAIRTTHNGVSLGGPTIMIRDAGIALPPKRIMSGPRIGVDYAGPDALLPYRFHFHPDTLS